MKIPVIRGLIERRILINFTADPQVVQPLLPAGFRPKLYKGKAIAGICLIRLKHVRPKGLPGVIGIASENGAHRIAVEWEEHGVPKEGVYIPRRDTSSKLNVLAGGRIFPGKHYAATFNVQEGNGHYHVDYTSSDQTHISVTAKETDTLKDSIFDSLADVSAFFQKGSTGYSPIDGNCLQGLELYTYTWEVRPLEVQDVKATFFEAHNIPVQFDNALLMTNIEHEWRGAGEKKYR